MEHTLRKDPEIAWLSSPALARIPGLLHGFTAPGPRSPEAPAQVRSLLRALGADGLPAARIRQVHGRRVILVEGPPSPGAPAEEADGSVSARAGIALSVQTADCLPVLLHDPEAGASAAVHAGWRGLLSGVLEEAVGRLRRDAGADPSRLLAAIGPSIGPCCYEVGPEVRGEFLARGLRWESAFLPASGNGVRPHLDLRAGARIALGHAGVPEEAVEASGLCTRCRGDLFPSWRRDGPRAGRLVAVIARRA